MPQHWRGHAVFWDMTGNCQCFAAACSHIHWRGRRLQHLRFLQWKLPAWYSEPCRMGHYIGRKRLLETKAKDTKILLNIQKYETQQSDQGTKQLHLAAETWLWNDKWPMTTITTLTWDTTNLLKTYTVQDIANTGGILWRAQATHLVCRLLSGSLVQPWRKVKQHLKWLLIWSATNMSLTMAVLPSDKLSSQTLGRGVRIASYSFITSSIVKTINNLFWLCSCNNQIQKKFSNGKKDKHDC